MIISFHYIYCFGIDFLKKIIGTNVLIACEEIEIMPNEQELENSIKFDPPVYRQRYGRVFDTLIDERWRTKITKLCDFGCAEFGLFVFLKGLNRLNHIFLVDIDEELLKYYIRRVHPLTIEYLRRREQQLQVSVFAGSVADPDYNILNVDVVTAIELIEHLYPDTLEAFPYNVFYYIHPKIVIITTPNADFNILFSSNSKRFRHYDHKFEWTREQFENWANNIISRFPDYVVTFTGIGEGPEHTKHLGECSQMALFIRKDVLNEDYILEKFTKTCNCDFDAECKGQICDSIVKCSCTCSSCSPSFSWGICRYNSSSKIINIEMENNKDHPYNTFYKLIEKIEYPFEQDSRTEEEKMLDEFRYRIASMGQLTGRFFVDERERCEIPVIDLLYGNFGEDITGKEVARLLERNGYRIEECLIEETGLSEICVIYDPMDKLTSSSEGSDVESSNNSVCYQVEDTLSDWDEPQDDPVLNVEECRKDIKDPIESHVAVEKINEVEMDIQMDTENVTPVSNICLKDFDTNNGFPNWLLQILGNQVAVEDAIPITELDEPHFYCQGDGLGVHPSILAVEVDDEEDDDESTNTTNNTADFAEVDQGISSHDASSLPEDSQGIITDTQDRSEEESADRNRPAATTQLQNEVLDSVSNLSDGESGNGKNL